MNGIEERIKFAFHKGQRALFMLLMLYIIGLAGCTAQQGQVTVQPAVTVRFLVKGEVISQQEIALGTCPETVEPDIEGLTIAAWQNVSGQEVVPQDVPVEVDTDYFAVVYPALSNHVPYLFPDENGFIRPDDILTADELTLAIHMLAEEAAWQYLPNLPSGSLKENTETLRRVLDNYFTPQAISAAFSGVEEGPVTRGTFTYVMNRLLGRGDDELVVVTYGEYPRDLDMNREDCADVLEASIYHVRNANGLCWEEAVMELTWEPGFFNLCGWLYYADETGHIVRDTQVGSLTFDSDGRYTSGDEELDAMVVEILWNIIKENPDAKGTELLHKVYEYSRDSFSYLRKDSIAFGASDWEIEYAKVMFSGGMGNCYNYAAVFWALTRGLGYETRAISGWVGPYALPHGWAEIDIDGMTYLFDPELEMAYRFEPGYEGLDLFMKTYDQVPERKYTRPKAD